MFGSQSRSLSLILFISVSFSLSLCPSASLSLCLSISLPLCLSVSLSLCLSVSLSLSLSLCLSLSVSLHQSLSLQSPIFSMKLLIDIFKCSTCLFVCLSIQNKTFNVVLSPPILQSQCLYTIHNRINAQKNNRLSN